MGIKAVVSTQVHREDRALERQGRRLGKSAGWFLCLAVAFEFPGILLFVLASSSLKAIGIGLIGLGAVPALVAIGLFASMIVAGWSAHRRPFA